MHDHRRAVGQIVLAAGDHLAVGLQRSPSTSTQPRPLTPGVTITAWALPLIDDEHLGHADQGHHRLDGHGLRLRIDARENRRPWRIRPAFNSRDSVGHPSFDLERAADAVHRGADSGDRALEHADRDRPRPATAPSGRSSPRRRSVPARSPRNFSVWSITSLNTPVAIVRRAISPSEIIRLSTEYSTFSSLPSAASFGGGHQDPRIRSRCSAVRIAAPLNRAFASDGLGVHDHLLQRRRRHAVVRLVLVQLLLRHDLPLVKSRSARASLRAAFCSTFRARTTVGNLIHVEIAGRQLRQPHLGQLPTAYSLRASSTANS